MTPEERAREFVETGFRDLGVKSLEPYVKIIAELIQGALDERPKLYIVEHGGHYLGGTSLVVAEDEHQARILARAKLDTDGLPGEPINSIVEFDITTPRAAILTDGDY